MRMTFGWAGLRTSAAALALAVGAASGARADVIPATADMTYTTSGQIDTSAGVSGTNVIGFNSVNTSSGFNAPSQFSLGEFVVAALPDGKSTTYTNTPFSITYLDNTVNGAAPSPNETPIVLTGVLNGTITGAGQSNVVATFDHAVSGTGATTTPSAVTGDATKVTSSAVSLQPQFRTGDFLNTLVVADPTIHLVPSTSNGGMTSAQAGLTVSFSPSQPPSGQTVPEPTSIALFLTTLGGLGLRRRLRAAR